jgi:hypothetical protein
VSEFIQGLIKQFLNDYKSNGLLGVWSYLVLTCFLILIIIYAITLVKHIFFQVLIHRSDQKVVFANVVEKKVIRQSIFMRLFIFKETKDKYIVVMRSKKYGDLEFEDVEFYAHSQIGKRYDVTITEIDFFGRFKESKITEIKYSVD